MFKFAWREILFLLPIQMPCMKVKPSTVYLNEIVRRLKMYAISAPYEKEA